MKKLLLLLVALASLATFAQAQPLAVNSPVIDAATWCAQAQWEWAWDPISKIGIARGPQGEWRFREGGAYVAHSRQLTHLPFAAYREGGRFMVPASSLPSKSSMEPGSIRRLQRIVVDAGHGGKDPGAISPFGTREKDLVLKVALLVQQELERLGLDVKMTRDQDIFIPLADRAKIANEWKADLFVSIHANAAQTRNLKGFEIFTLSEETDDTLLARERAQKSGSAVDAPAVGKNKTLNVILWDMRSRENRRQALRVAQQVSGRVADSAPLEAKRLKNANFHVLKNTECPSVLIEIGYLTNRRDQSRLTSPKYQRSLVNGIIEGIQNFRKEYEATDGFARR